MFFNENSILPFSGYLDPVTAIAGASVVSGFLGRVPFIGLVLIVPSVSVRNISGEVLIMLNSSVLI